MKRVIFISLLVVFSTGNVSANANLAKIGVKSVKYYDKISRMVKVIFKGKYRKRDFTFRQRALDNTPRDAQGRYRDAYTGKYHNKKNMEADHIYPYSKGGSDATWNSAMTKTATNRSKRAKIQPITMLKGYGRNAEVQKVGGGVAAGGVAIGVAP